MTLNTRLRHLEQRHEAARWCRCGYGLEHWRAEFSKAMETGGLHPPDRECPRCGGRRVQIQYVPMDPMTGRLRPSAIAW